MPCRCHAITMPSPCHCHCIATARGCAAGAGRKSHQINKLNHVFGLVSELNDKKNYELINFINDNNVQNILQMGVPIGKGAQRFQWQAINQIKEISLDCPFLSTIELDGGLTFDIINTHHI